MQLILHVILSLVLAISCTKKSKNSGSDASEGTDSSTSSGLSTAAKLSSPDCFDPDLTRVSQGVTLTLCDGSVGEGTLAIRGTWDAETAFPGAGVYTQVTNTPSADDLCKDVNVNGEAGAADCTGYQGNVGSFMHRDKGTADPTQISLSDEKGNSTLPLEYREIPDTTKDDYGTPDNASINRVVRGTNVWNGAVPRLVCGMGIASVAGRIADCDTRHTVKPDWDKASTDGAINWQGAVNGNAAEGDWTLISVYKTGASNGDTCDAACYEIWRDDRTGLLWSDRLGDRSNTLNSGKWNWCVATGNTEDATNGWECRPGQAGSYNNQALSLCAESLGVTTPDSRWTETNATDLGAPTYSGANEILDAKGGMRLTINYDPAGDSPVIRWRVPTVHDYYSGLVNGMFYVLPHIHYTAAPFAEWTASIYANDRLYAWEFDADYGGITYGDRFIGYGVRCVGRP